MRLSQAIFLALLATSDAVMKRSVASEGRGGAGGRASKDGIDQKRRRAAAQEARRRLQKERAKGL